MSREQLLLFLFCVIFSFGAITCTHCRGRMKFAEAEYIGFDQENCAGSPVQFAPRENHSWYNRDTLPVGWIVVEAISDQPGNWRLLGPAKSETSARHPNPGEVWSDDTLGTLHRLVWFPGGTHGGVPKKEKVILPVQHQKTLRRTYASEGFYFAKIHNTFVRADTDVIVLYAVSFYFFR